MARLEKIGHSSNTTRRSRDPEVTQAEILAAAEEEFAKHGFNAARTETIAAQTGVTKAMIYYYFKSKEGLYQAVLERALSDYLSLSQQLNLEQLPPEQALEQYLRGFLAHLSCNHNLPLILFYEAVQNQGKHYRRSAVQTVYITLSALLERGVADGSFRSLDPRHTAINVLGTCVFYFTSHENLKHHWHGKRMLSQEMLEQHTQEAIELILAGVRLQGKQ